jgi:sec-independent protein translocase protein TatA
MLASAFGPDMIWVAIIAIVVLFGGSQLPKLARNVGEARKEFSKGAAEPGPTATTTTASNFAAPQPAAMPVAPVDDKVTLSRTELDALLAEREARARRESAGPAA